MKTMLTHFNIESSDKYASTLRGDTDMENGNFMTSKTRDRILAEIQNIEDSKPEISTRIGDARLQGGLEENEELLMALDDLQRIDMELSRYNEMLQNVQIIIPLSPGKKKKVVIGTTVSIMNIKTKAEFTYTILGVHDSDPNNGIISFKSPMGQELLAREVGDEIEVNGSYYEITKIVVKKLQ
jgi:transcription elongation GreA/GreB family factor